MGVVCQLQLLTCLSYATLRLNSASRHLATPLPSSQASLAIHDRILPDRGHKWVVPASVPLQGTVQAACGPLSHSLKSMLLQVTCLVCVHIKLVANIGSAVCPPSHITRHHTQQAATERCLHPACSNPCRAR